MEFHEHIWNHHWKYIEISTNTPVIGSVICEIDIKTSQISESNITTCVLSVIHIKYADFHSNDMAPILSVL